MKVGRWRKCGQNGAEMKWMFSPAPSGRYVLYVNAEARTPSVALDGAQRESGLWSAALQLDT